MLTKHNSKPNKLLGQNFLIDKNVLSKIITASEIKNTDTIIEVGPGIGTLTKELAQNAGKVIAIEKDKVMCQILAETTKDYKNIEIVEGDILKISNFSNFKLNSNFKFQISNYKVVANIPYYLTSPLIRKFLESENQPEIMILMLQKEVAQRICSKPPNMSLLAVSVQFYAEPKIISYVSKNCFWPSPKVDSAIIKIVPHKTYRPPTSIQLFFKIAKAGFSQPRKQLGGNLSKMLKLKKAQVDTWLLENKISPTQRAETLSVEDWQNLTTSESRAFGE
ncbi:MAG: 16S rRNA (adenine(1518)-N(6)/adenine(1519)-N(6))-dimethyltransferase RsmA [Candidatus Staskawiczbacteria bacterium]|nr:16S rRNA (adenine(1518)-N(6)/adenine(1519)-N(6))-dimethyltransferase RsmA [Candidatus Staskawiczbacteria bacterium]